MAKSYQGWPSWNQWNVALYVANDYGLYSLAKRCYRETGSIDAAAKRMLRQVIKLLKLMVVCDQYQ